MRFPRLPVDDELEIRSLFARYGHLADAGDTNFGMLFIEDGSWTRMNSGNAGQGGTGLPPETIRGRKAIVQQMMVETVQRKFRGLVHHQMTDFYVEPGATGDQALSHARALITDWRDGPGKLSMFATYHIRFARTPDGWLMQSAECSLLPA